MMPERHLKAINQDMIMTPLIPSNTVTYSSGSQNALDGVKAKKWSTISLAGHMRRWFEWLQGYRPTKWSIKNNLRRVERRVVRLRYTCTGQ